ncbi:hypothetical protein BGP_5304 [Beggiatoa sp. PS]|nr:hypothetical protein BGP_5304 [Beggiatoa sp. PS]
MIDLKSKIYFGNILFLAPVPFLLPLSPAPFILPPLSCPLKPVPFILFPLSFNTI